MLHLQPAKDYAHIGLWVFGYEHIEEKKETYHYVNRGKTQKNGDFWTTKKATTSTTTTP